MMEAEQYDQAVFYYEKAYQESPDDEDIVSKLSFARSRLVGANLIEVRMFRQSQLQVKAAKKLNESLAQMIHWKITADSAVKTTINEEVGFAARWLDKELPRLAHAKKHNRFHYSLKQYQHILDSGYNDAIINQAKPEMDKLGQKQCASMQSQLTPLSHYFTTTWQAYCATFGKPVHYKLDKDPSRFTQPKLTTSHLRLSKAIGINTSTYRQTLQQKIQHHPWFSPSAISPLPLSVQGNIRYEKRTTPHTFSFIYPAKKEVYEIIRDKHNPQLIKRKLISSTPIERTVTVRGHSHIETVSHNLTITAKMHQYSLASSEVSANTLHQTYSHQASFKKNNVYPLAPDYMNKKKWFAAIGNTMMDDLNNQLDAHWIAAFCDAQNTFKLSTFENATRCAVLKPEHPSVQSWSQDLFGLTYEELIILLG